MARRSPTSTSSGARTAKRTGSDPTLILMVRHGVTDTTGKVLPGRAKGLHLSKAGRRQANKAARRIAKLDRVDAVYASPLERTRETAAPIAEARGLRVRTDSSLLECDFGRWTGRKLSALRRKSEWATVQNRPSVFRFPDGESFAEMQLRIWNGLLTLVKEYPGGTVVAVSHADPIKAAVAMALGIHLDLLQRTVISPCSITPVLFTSAGPVVLGVNSAGDDLRTLAPS